MAGTTDIHDLRFAPDLAAALGDMVVAWASAETALGFAYAAVLGVEVNKAMVGYYRIPSFEARTKVIRSLVLHWETDKYEPKKILQAVSKLNALAKARNKWIHGTWTVDRDTRAVFVISHPSLAPAELTPVKRADIMNHVLAVQARTNDLHDLVMGAGVPRGGPPVPEWMKPWRDTGL